MNSKLRGILLLLIGFFLIAAGVVAVFLLTQEVLLPRVAPAAADQTMKSPVVVVTRDMFLGDLIQAADLSTIEVPVEMVPRNAFTTPDTLINKTLKTDLVQGEMVLSHNIADPTNINHDLAFILSEEHVLFAFDTKDVMTLESVVQRGDIIDILVSKPAEVVVPEQEGQTTPTDEEETTSRIFTFNAFQNVEVTAMVMDIIEEENPDPVQAAGAPQQKRVIRTYLLAMKPQDALVLKHLKDTGSIFDIVLRSPTSKKQFDLTPVTEEYIVELYGLEILP